MSNIRRSGRNKGRIDYRTLDSKGKESKEETVVETEINSDEDQEFLDSMEEILSQSEGTGSDDKEDGEISNISEESGSESDSEEEDDDIAKLKNILRKKQEECVKLKAKVNKEKQKDDKKKKEMSKLLEQIKAMDKTKVNLQKSLDASRSSSRNSTPAASPKRKNKETTKDRRIVRKKTRKQMPENASEYTDTLNSMLKLKQGAGNEAYSELMFKAMEATDNIMSIKESQKSLASKKQKTNNKSGKNKIGNNKTTGNKAENVLDLLNKVNESSQANRSEVNADNSVNAKTIGDSHEQMSKEATQLLLNKCVNAKSAEESIGEKIIEIIHEGGNAKNNEDEIDKLCEKLKEAFGGRKGNGEDPTVSDTKNKKLTSGKCTKPDESDIKRVVKFAHERLDPRHIVERDFDKLQFHTLIAGELELAQSCDSIEEKQARIGIAKTLCYHKSYLDDKTLRDGYDQMLKRVERGTQEWDEALGEHLHELLNYKANVMMRERFQDGKEGPFTKVESRKSKVTDNRIERVVYCNDYNNGNCNQRDHHEGKFAGKKVTRFHICRKCYNVAGETRSHRDGSDECGRKDL